MIPVHLSFLPTIIFHQEMMSLQVLLYHCHRNPNMLQGEHSMVKSHNAALSVKGKEPEKTGMYTCLAPLQTLTDIKNSGQLVGITHQH